MPFQACTGRMGAVATRSPHQRGRGTRAEDRGQDRGPRADGELEQSRLFDRDAPWRCPGGLRDKPNAVCSVVMTAEGASGHREMMRLMVAALDHQAYEAQGLQFYDILR